MPMGTQPPSQTLLFLALFAAQALFAGSYVASKILVEAFPPLVWAAIRCSVAAGLLMALCAWKRKPIPREPGFLATAFKLSVVGCFLNQALFLEGIARTTPAHSAIHATLIPVFTLVLAVVRGDERFTPRAALSLGLAWAGVWLLVSRGTQAGEPTVVGDLLTLLNCVAYATYLALGRRFVASHDTLVVTAWIFLFGSLQLDVAATAQWARFTPPVWTPTLAWSAAYAIVGATVVAYLLMNWVLARVPASVVALSTYVQPVVAAGLGWWFLGDAPDGRMAAATVCIFVGVLLAARLDAFRRIKVTLPRGSPQKS